jgi:hypothetical protein
MTSDDLVIFRDHFESIFQSAVTEVGRKIENRGPSIRKQSIHPGARARPFRPAVRPSVGAGGRRRHGVALTHSDTALRTVANGEID